MEGDAPSSPRARTGKNGLQYGIGKPILHDMNYRHRLLEEAIAQATKRFGAVVLTGPRQSGKTSLLNYLAGTSPSAS